LAFFSVKSNTSCGSRSTGPEPGRIGSGLRAFLKTMNGSEFQMVKLEWLAVCG